MTEDGKPPIPGNFIGPSDNEPRVPASKPEPEPNKTRSLEDQISELEEEILRDAEPNRPLTPEELERQYKAGLEEVGLTLKEARSIMEGILVKGYFEESHRLGPITVVIRSRTYNDTLRTQRYLEAENPTYNMNVNDLVARYNVASSLVQYGDNTFSHPEYGSDAAVVEREFQKRLTFVQGRPAIVMSKLMALVYKLDLRLAAAFAEGAPQDF